MTKKPDWLPDDLWTQLEEYTSTARRADPTDGFMLKCVKHSPEFKQEEWRSMSAATRRTYCLKVLGIPKTKLKDSAGDEVSR